MRSGKVIFNEVHQFENYDNIKVFITGQGKVAQPRVGIFTSNGDVSDGPLDDYLARGRRILFEGEPDNGFLPFICCLDSIEQVHDPACWYMANPSLSYLPHLLQEIKDEYQDWITHPEQNGDFFNKADGSARRIQRNLRHGLRQGACDQPAAAEAGRLELYCRRGLRRAVRLGGRQFTFPARRRTVRHQPRMAVPAIENACPCETAVARVGTAGAPNRRG